MIDPDGFRPNVAIVLMNDQRRVFWAQRANSDGWQFPQGGMRTDETPEEAMYRELEESAFSLDSCEQPEFCRYKWVDFWYPADNVITFKRRVYRKALTLLEPLAESHLESGDGAA